LALTWRLLATAMPMTILVVALLPWALMGLGLAAALLIAALLVPTDPSDVEVGGPGKGVLLRRPTISDTSRKQSVTGSIGRVQE
jgi:hypothetical protein